MCGFLGEVRLSNAGPIDEPRWQMLLEDLTRRGPDSVGFWSATCPSASVWLGVRRLSIRDPSSLGTMPMHSFDRRYTIAFNGELYSYEFWRERFRRQGWRFNSRSDAEVAMAAVALGGAEALAEIDGIYALALWDRFDQKLTLIRDRFGVKPLYVAPVASGIIFGSELDSLLASTIGLLWNLNPEAVRSYFRLGYTPHSIEVAGPTRMLGPSSWMTYSVWDRQLRSAQLPPAMQGADLKALTGEEDVERAIASATDSQLDPEGVTALLLSGGVDSPLLAAYASEGDTRGVRAFSLSLGRDDSSEVERAVSHAAKLGISHETVQVRPSEVPSLFEAAVGAAKEPLGDEGLLATLAVSRRIREHGIRVAIAGDGADELFMGYIGRQSRVLTSVNDDARERLHLYGEAYGRTRGDARSAIFGDANWLDPRDVRYLKAPTADSAERWIQLCELENFLPYILLKTDRGSMYHSIEARVPYLSLPVAAIAMKLSRHELHARRGAVGKVALRALLARRGLDAPGAKRGFTAPVGEWMRGPLREPLEAAASRRAGLDGIEHDPAGIREIIRRHHTHTGDHSMVLWRMMMLDGWWSKVQALRVRGSASGSKPSTWSGH